MGRPRPAGGGGAGLDGTLRRRQVLIVLFLCTNFYSTPAVNVLSPPLHTPHWLSLCQTKISPLLGTSSFRAKASEGITSTQIFQNPPVRPEAAAALPAGVRRWRPLPARPPRLRPPLRRPATAPQALVPPEDSSKTDLRVLEFWIGICLGSAFRSRSQSPAFSKPSKPSEDSSKEDLRNLGFRLWICYRWVFRKPWFPQKIHRRQT